MKKALGILFILVATFVVFSSRANAQTNSCNVRCQVNDDCATGQRCYVGVCRNTLCPASSTCSCGSSPTPVSSVKPTATPYATSTPRPSASASASPKATPITNKVATPSTLTKTPDTGFETLLPVGIAFVLYAGGSSLIKKNA